MNQVCYAALLGFVLCSLMLVVPGIAAAGCCGGSLVVELVYQPARQACVFIGDSERESLVCFDTDDPDPQYHYYMCICLAPTNGVDCEWRDAYASFPYPDWLDLGCTWLSAMHGDPASCDIGIGGTCSRITPP